MLSRLETLPYSIHSVSLGIKEINLYLARMHGSFPTYSHEWTCKFVMCDAGNNINSVEGEGKRGEL